MDKVIIGNATLYCGDCFDILPTLDVRADAVITDPPYCIRNTRGHGLYLQKRMESMLGQLQDEGLNLSIEKKYLEIIAQIQDIPNLYIFCNTKQIPMYLDYFHTEQGCKFDILIWHKTNAFPSHSNKYLADKEFILFFRRGGYCNPRTYEDGATVFTSGINIKDKKRWLHPTIKPLALIEKIVRNSTAEEQLIVDPFMGSGTTGVAAAQMGRAFIGIEQKKKYFDIACERIEHAYAEYKNQFPEVREMIETQKLF